MRVLATPRFRPAAGLIALAVAASGPSPSDAAGRCEGGRGARERVCDVAVARARRGAVTLPSLPVGAPGNLELLEPEERAVVAEADARAAELRTRPVVLQVGRPGVEVRIEQTGHAFRFGFPIDLRRFTTPEDLAFYTQITTDHFHVAVIENNAKWSKVEPEPDVRFHDDVDADVAWAESLGFTVKGHTLMWGIVPPFSSSGVPAWLLDRFGLAPLALTPAEQDELRERLRRHVFDLVERYRGRIAIWDVTNETLQPLAQWFVQALGPAVVSDVFRWAHEADPDATLVFNEWIVEVFTGFPFPTAADVRDRVIELLDAGVPIHALGQQAHFTPAAAFAGLPVDLSQRTRIDDYALALDTLAEAGLPLHITETNFIAPDDPELRAAHAEALMRLWWGHPAVEQIVFWGPWNKVAGRDEFDVGFWDDDGNLSRHGEAVLSLLNDRWRTKRTAVSDARGRIELLAQHGDYVAQWSVRGEPRHASFAVEPGPGRLRIVLAGP
jgi:GH35 family endo-1,4-beta-xylanase